MFNVQCSMFNQYFRLNMFYHMWKKPPSHVPPSDTRWDSGRLPELPGCLANRFRTSIFANSCVCRHYVSHLVPCPTVPRTSTVDCEQWSVVSSMFQVQCSTVQCSYRTPIPPLDDLKPPATAGGTDRVVRSLTEEFTTKHTKRHEAFRVFFVVKKSDQPGTTRKDTEPASSLPNA